MRDMIEQIVRHLVDVEGEVQVKESRAESLVLFEVRVAPTDFGKLIGRQGEHAKALRLLVKSAGRKHGLNAHIDILDPKKKRPPITGLAPTKVNGGEAIPRPSPFPAKPF